MRDLGIEGLQQRKGSAWPVANAAQSLHSDSLLNRRTKSSQIFALTSNAQNRFPKKKKSQCPLRVYVCGVGGWGGVAKCLAIKASARMTSCSSPAPTA